MSSVSFKCNSCSVLVSLTDEQYALLKQSCQTFYCLWGHAMSYSLGKTRWEKDVEKAQAERDEAFRQRDLERQRCARFAEEAETAKRREAAAKGQATKLRIRTAAGVCPCCNRSFVALARHMKMKHPTFKTDEVMQ